MLITDLALPAPGPKAPLPAARHCARNRSLIVNPTAPTNPTYRNSRRLGCQRHGGWGLFMDVFLRNLIAMVRTKEVGARALGSRVKTMEKCRGFARSTSPLPRKGNVR